jgi:4-amino-4-deoxy-L-arabinose transferase-like glycosyltransferase
VARQPGILIATLGTKPQVVTTAVDLLLSEGRPPMDTCDGRLAGRRFILLSLMALAAGAALALFRLGEDSLWLDESYTWWFTRLGWGDLLRAARIDAVNPPLYYLFAKALSPDSLFGAHQSGFLEEAALRFPSVLAQIAGIAAAIYLGYQLGGRVGGLAAGFLWAAHPLTLWAARDARPYAQSAALAAGVVGAFFYLRRNNSKIVMVLAGVGLALGLLTHYFFFVMAAALILVSAADLRRSPAFFRRWTVLTLLALIPLAAWLVWFFSMGSPSLGIGWIRLPVVDDIPLTLWNLASGYGGVSDIGSAVFGLAVIGIAAGGLAQTTRTDWLKIAFAGLALPLLAVWVISQRRPVYVDRYFVVLLPFVAALVALGAQAIAQRTEGWPQSRRRAMRWIAGAGFSIVALAVALTVHTAAKFDKEDWRGLAGFLQSQGVSGQALSLSEPEIALPLSVYFEEDLLGKAPRLVPACGERCWWVLRQPYTATHALTQSVQERGRAGLPSTPEGCDVADSWRSPTGLAVWRLECVG